MKREIKFRVFDPSSNIMFVPDVVSGDGRNWYATGRDYENGIDCNDCELMQFTGLNDKNGKEIYEGDILREDRGSIGKVIFINGAFKCQMTHSKYAPWQIYHKKHKFYFEIIGNIYENPELLNQNP